ncbi:MAG: Ig-like domain-containing protein, partial [Bacteroidetes bacterium]|nr:Ig-like domain-containing protein [Bacteroidota bacterium]
MKQLLQLSGIIETRKFQIILTMAIWAFMMPLFNNEVRSQNCTVNAGIPDSICVNQPMLLHGNSSGLYQAGGGDIHWSQKSGPSVNIVSPYSFNTNVTGYVSNQVYWFYFSAKCLDGSLVYDSVWVKVKPITTSVAGTDLISCPGVNILTLNGNAPGAGESGLWQVVGTNHGVTINSPTSRNSTVTLAQNACGITTLRWTITGTNSCYDFDDMTVTNIGGVSPVTAGTPIIVGGCYTATTSATLNGSFGGCGISGQSGHWTFISGPSTPVFGNANSNSSSISNLVEGTYTVQWTVSGPCANGTATNTITVSHALGGVTGASAGGAQVFCDTRLNFVLTGNNPLYANETGTWVQTSGRPGVSIANPTNPITGVTITNPTGSYTFSYTIVNSLTGCSSSASTSVTYNVNPTISLDATPVLPCDDSIATITYSLTGGGSLEWSIVSGPTNWYYPTIPTGWFAATTSPQLIYHLSGDGTYVIRFRVVPGSGNACTTVTQEVSVTTSHSPTHANSGTPQILGCNITSTSMAGNFISHGTGTWTFVSGPSVPVFGDIHNPSSPISGLIPGRPYRLRWLVSGGPTCPTFQSDTRIIVANGAPSTAAAGPDSTICNYFPYRMLGNVPALNEVGTWTVSPAGPTFLPDSHAPNAVLSNLAAGQVYTFTWTISNACSSSADICLLTTTGGVDPLIANAGPDQCNALGTSVVTLHGNDPNPYNGLWTKLTGPGTVTFADPTAYLTQASGLANGTYTFEWQISYPGCGSTRDTVMITIANHVTPSNAGADRTICGTTLNLAGNAPAAGETGRWIQTVGPGGAVIVDTALYNSLVTNLTNGVYQFNWIISSGACGTSVDSVKFYISVPSTPAYAGPDQLICGPNPLSVLMAATPAAVGTAFWSMVSGPNTPTFSSITDPAATVSNLISGTYIFKWTTAGGPYCPISEDLVTINVGESANAGADQLLCAVTQTNLVGNIGSNGVWSQSKLNPLPPYNATILTTSPNSATVSGLLTGTYTFLYTIGGGLCPNSVDSMQVIISGQPSPAQAGPDQFVCNLSSLILAATQPLIGTGTWTKLYPTGGGGSFSPDNHAYNAVFNGAVGGQLYIFRWTVADGGCSNADEVRIENYGVTTPCDAGPAQDICGTMTNMAATLAAHGVGTWTQVSGPPATIVSPNLNTTQVTGLALETSSVFRWTVKNGVCDSCTSVVTLTTHEEPTAPLAGDDQLWCNSANSATLAGNQLSFGTGTWSQIGTTPNLAVITDPSLYNTTVTGLIPGVYTFRWTSQLGTCSAFDDMQITIYATPSTANAGGDATICLFQPVTLTGNALAAGETGLWTQLPGGPSTAFILNPTSPVTNVTNMVVGIYQFKWTITVNPACPSSEDITEVTISSIPSNAIAGPNQILCNTQVSATMHATTPITGTGTWSQVGITPAVAIIANPNQSNTLVTNLGAIGTYIFKWTVSTGDPTCDKTDIMQITKYSDVVVAGPNDVTICNGGTATVSVSASGGSGVYTYQWDYSTTDSPYDWHAITGATNASYTTPALTSDIWYHCTVECGSVVTPAAHVIVNPDPGISVQPVGGVSCLGVPTVLSVSVTGGTGTFSYQWERSAGTCAAPFWVPISGANASTYSASPGLTTSYHVLVSQTGNGCNSLTSDCITLTVPRILTHPTGTTLCEGGTHSMTISADAGGATLSYQWQEASAAGGPWADVTTGTGGNSTTYITDALTTGNHYYKCVISVTSPYCADMITNSALVQVLADPAFTLQSSDVSMCQGGTASLSVTVTGGLGAFSYQWQQSNGDCTGTWSNILGATTNSYSTGQLNTPNTYYYQCIVSQTGVGCGPVVSRCIKVTVAGDPTITTPPVGATICYNGSHTMSVVVDGGTGTLSYQWQNSTGTCASPTWSNIFGATQSSYTATSVQATTSYHVLISQDGVACNSLTSGCVTVYIPHIVTNPTSASICNGGTATLSTTVTSDGGTATYTYQWQECTTFGGIYANVVGGTGANSPTYTTAALSTTNYYKCVITVSNPTCSDLITSVATVTVVADPIISTQPVGNIICSGGNFTMSVVASGGTPVLVYQWQKSIDGINGWTTVGTNSASYNTGAIIADTYYRVIISATGNGCDATTSTTALVTVNNLTPGSIATDQTICVNDDPLAFTSVDATGDGIITYQWEKSVTSPGTSGFSIIAGATNSTYDEVPLIADAWYRRVATSTLTGVPCTATTNTLHIWVNNLTPGVIQSSQTICSGSNATQFTNLTVPVSDGALSYQWQSSLTGSLGSFTSITGATNATYTALALTADTWYQRITTSTLNTKPCSEITNILRVTVNNLDPGAISAAQTICATQTPAPFTNDITGTGDGTITFQWESSITGPGSGFGTIAGATNAAYAPGPISVDTWFRRRTRSFLNSVNCDGFTSVVKINVNTVTGGTIAAAQTICSGGDPAAFTNSPAPSGEGVLTYQWQDSPTGLAGSFTSISGATNVTFDPGVLTADTWYQRITTSTIGGDPVICSATSNILRVLVNNVTPGSIAGDQTICTGGIPATLTSVSAGAGDGTITYQWQSSPNGTTFSNISGATGANYTAVAALIANTWYHRVATSTIGGDPVTCQAISNNVMITVIPDPVITIEPSDITICSGTATTMSVTVTGGIGSYGYQWQTGTGPCNGTNWSSILGATDLNYTTLNLTQTTIYRVLVTQTGLGCGPLTSRCVTVSVPRITAQPAGTTLCAGGTHTMNVTIDGGSATLAYQWQVSTLDCAFGYFDITGATNASYTTTTLPSGTRYYRCVISVTNPACATLYTTCAQVIVVDDPGISVQPLGTTLCSGSSHTMSVTVTGGTGAFSYQWQSNTSGCGSTFNNIGGATTSSYTAASMTTTTYYQVLISQTGVGCNSMISGCATITVINPPTAAAGSNATICETTASYTLSGSSATNYASILWSTSGTGAFNNAATLHPVYTPSPADIAAGTVTLTLNVTANSPCANTSASMILTIQHQPVANAGPDVTRCASALSYTVTGATSTYASTLSWSKGLGSGILTNASTISPTYTFGAGETSVTLTLTASPAGGSQCSAAIDAMVITIVPAATASAGTDATMCETAVNYTLSGSSATNYASLLWSTSGTGAFNNAGNLHPVYTPSPADIAAGTVTLTLNVTANSPCANTSASMTLAIQRQPVANAGPDVSRCASALSYTVTGATATYATTLSWSKGLGSGVLTNANTISPTYTFGVGESSVTLTLTATPAGGSLCSPATDAMVITIVPAATAVSGGNATICQTSTYLLISATATNYTTLLWTTSGDGYFNNNQSLNPIYTPGISDIALGHADLTLTATGTSPCAAAASTMRLTILPSPVVNAGVDGNMCSVSGSYTVSGATASNYSALLWTHNGTGHLTNATGLTPTYTFGLNETGPVTLTITATGNTPCGNASDQMVLTIVPGPIVNAGPDGETCQTTSHTISGAIAYNYTSILWTHNGLGTLTNATTLTPTYAPAPAESGPVNLTMTVTGNSPCSGAFDVMVLTITPRPIIDAGIGAPSGGVTCESKPFTITGATATNVASILWTAPGPGTLTNATTLSPTYTPAAGQTGFVTLTLTGKGLGTCSDVSDQVILEFKQSAIISTQPAGAAICRGTTHTMIVSASGGTGTLSYQWQQSSTGNAGSYSDITGASNTSYTTPTMNVLGSTWYHCVITQNGSPCDPLVSAPAKCEVGACCPVTYSERNVYVCKNSTNFPVDVLLNGDYSPEGLPLHVNQTPVSNPAHGTISWLSGSTFVYTPTSGYTGTDRVIIGICDNAAPVPCCTNDTIFYNIVQAVTADPGVNQLLCNQYMTFLTGNWPPAGSTGNWTLVSKPAGSPAVTMGPSNSPMASVAGLTTSTTPYVFRYTITTTFGSITCTDHADITVTNYHSPSSPFAGNDQKLCLSATTVSATLTGNIPIYGNGYWQLVSIPAGGTTPIIASPSSPTTLVTNLSAGTYTFSWGIYNGVCDTIKDMSDVTIYPPCDVEAGAAGTICQGSTYTLNGSSALNCGSMMWGTNGSGYFSDPTALHPIYTPGASDITHGSVVLYVKCSSCCGIPCPGDSSAMTLTIVKSPTAFAGQNASICDVSEYTLSESTATNYASLLWTSPTGGTFTPDATSLHPTYTPTATDIANGSVTLTLKSIANTPCPDVTSNMVLTIWSSVVASSLTPASICEGSDYPFGGVTALNYTAINWTTSGTGTFSNPGILNPIYTPGTADVLAGTVTLTLNLTGHSPCAGTTRTMVLTIVAAPVANAGPDASICEGIAYAITGASKQNAPTVLWTFTPSGAGVLANAGTMLPTFTPAAGFTGDVTLTLTATGNAPCGAATDHMILTVMPGPTANAGLDATVCKGSAYTVSGAMAYNYTSILWTTSGSGSLTGATSLTPTYIPLPAETTVELSMTVFGFGGVCLATDAMTITYNVGPGANAGSDATTCEDVSHTVSGASAPNSSAVLWTTNGTGTLTDATTLTPTYTPAFGELGAVILTLTVTGAGQCPVAVDFMVLTILPKTMASAGEDENVCASAGSITLSTATASLYSALLWSTTGPGTLTGETTLT